MITDSVIRTCTNLLAYLAEPAARAIALGCLAAIVLGALRVKRVPVRLFAWTTVLYGAVAIALAGWLLPGVTMRVPGAATVERIIEANARVQNAMATLKAYVSVTKTAEAKNAIETKGLKDSGDAARLVAENLPSTDELREGKAAEYRRSPKNANSAREEARSATSAMSYLKVRPTMPHDGDAGMSAGEGRPSAELRTSRSPQKANAARDGAGLSATDATSLSNLQESKGAEGRRAPKKAIPWAVVAAGIYAAIALLLLGRLLLGLALSHRLARLSEKIRDADAVRKLRFRAYASGLERVPEMAESELVSVPATLNVFRPVILLPAHWREWDEAKFDAILAHEVSHVARRDSLTQRISLVHRAIFWFSPLAWWLDRKLNELAEEASDEAALGAGADKNRYAEMLLGFFADLEAASGRVWWQGVSMASDGSRAGHAEKRVERILSWGGSITMKKSLAVALVAIAAPVIFVAAAVHPVIAQDKTQDDSKNVIMPGGPKAPALSNAPKGGVTAPAPVAPAMAAAPVGGVTGAVPPAPAIAGAPQGGVATAAMPPAPNPALAPVGPIQIRPSTPAAAPALMPVPGAPAHPPIVPGPIANGPVTPSAMTVPAIAAAAPMPPQSSTASEVRQAEAQVREAKRQLEKAEKAVHPDEARIRVTQEVLMKTLQVYQAMAKAQESMRAAMAQDQDNSTTITNGTFNMNSGPRYVMMSRNSNEVNMSGDEEDLQHAKELRKKISSDFIWFEKDEKSYVITDPDFIAKAKALFAPEEELGKQQDALGQQQDELGRQQDALGEKMEGVKVKIRDITPELEEIRARMKQLNAEGGATQEELGRLQSRLGQLQSEVGHSQSEAGAGQSDIGRQQAELGRKQGELGRRQGELGRQQGEIAKKASRELRQMFEDAIAKGIAKAE
ncbi:MAG TPA: M56 family metallopeptidase [Candidatus Acidoferrales bacterium]|nr:M56 family metallopeptidase [Candidatus Acidoferrales bacterium]